MTRRSDGELRSRRLVAPSIAHRRPRPPRRTLRSGKMGKIQSASLLRSQPIRLCPADRLLARVSSATDCYIRPCAAGPRELLLKRRRRCIKIPQPKRVWVKFFYCLSGRILQTEKETFGTYSRRDIVFWKARRRVIGESCSMQRLHATPPNVANVAKRCIGQRESRRRDAHRLKTASAKAEPMGLDLGARMFHETNSRQTFHFVSSTSAIGRAAVVRATSAPWHATSPNVASATSVP